MAAFNIYMIIEIRTTKYNKEFWSNKIDRKIEHDKTITEVFANRGWKVIQSGMRYWWIKN